MQAFKDVYYRDPKTGSVTVHRMYLMNANEALEKYPTEYSETPWPDTPPHRVTDMRPADYGAAYVKENETAVAEGPPVEERPATTLGRGVGADIPGKLQFLH